MLLIWCKEPRSKVMEALGSVLQRDPELKVEVCNVFSHLPDRPDLGAVLALGTAPMEHLAALKAIPKNRTVSNLRCIGHTVEGLSAPVLFSYSTGIGEIDWGKMIDLQTDTSLAMRLASTGSLLPHMGKYRYVDDFSDVLAKIDALYAANGGKRVDVGLDLETVGMDPYRQPADDGSHPGASIVTIQVCCEKGTADVVYFESREALIERINTDFEFMCQMTELLTSNKISMKGANLKFDLHWLKVWLAIDCTNFMFDTTLVGSILDENRSNALNVHAKIYTPLGGYDDQFNKSIDKSRMDLVDKEILLPYAAGDADATLQVAAAQKQLLMQDPVLTRFYVNVLHPAVRAMEMVEQGGVCVDMQAYDELETELNEEIDTLIEKAKRILGGRIVAKHRDLSKRGELNLTKASMLIDFMFSPMGLNLRPQMMTNSGKPSTAGEHLMMFKDVPEASEFVGLLSDYSSATKTLGTYVHGFKSHIRSDGRFHPTYYLFAGNKNEGEGGTNTGRLSCKDPAFQCLKGDSRILTDRGELTIQCIVEGYERGESFKVLTHTGAWRRVVGVYRNGVQPVFDVKFETGRLVTSTGNHPYLTERGWVRTDELKRGDIGYELRASHQEVHQPDLLQLGGNEEPLQQSNQQGLGAVRGTWDQGLREVDVLRELPCRHGGEACQGLVHRAGERGRGLRAGELQLGYSGTTSPEPNQQQEADSQWRDQDSRRVGLRSGDQSGTVALSALRGDVAGASLDEGDPWDREVFQAVAISCIEPAGECETFDLTIEGSHSFVANGVVVHNTIPKHTKWAKKLRRVFIAPPGMLVMENDYSQGELRVIACVADETNMIRAYQSGLDLHVLTPTRLLGLTVEEVYALKESDPTRFKQIRQMGKAGNFGLIYGMSAGGFQAYAASQYGVHLTGPESAEFRDVFFTTYPGLVEYHAQYKAHAKRFGYVRSPLGRVRHLPLINSRFGDVRSTAERQAINSPIQSTLSDMMIWAVAEADKRGWQKESPCFGLVHDAAYKYVPEDNWEMYAKREKELMENLPFEKVGWNPQLTFAVDGTIGKNMADMEEIHF